MESLKVSSFTSHYFNQEKMPITTLLADPETLNDWLRAAVRSKLNEFVSFARGLSEDHEAVMNALRYDWSNGQLEGLVNWLKLIERMMYGRAKFDLLRARVLHSR